MKILHIYKDYFPVLGGIENHIRLLAEAQAARGHDVTVLVTSLNRTPHTEHLNGVQIIFASRLAERASTPFSLEIFRRVRSLHPDIAHLHFPYPIGDLANSLFGQARATVLTYHSDIVRQRVAGALYTPFLHRILKGVKTIIATSPNYIESSPILSKWRDKCVVIPLAIPDASKFPGCQETTAEIRHHATELLFVGRLRYYKGLNFLLQAMPQIPVAHLTVVGIGPKLEEWKSLADSLGLHERVTWVGEVSDEDLPSYYAGCQVFVLPCSERSEAFGTVQLEAMAACKPIVSCDVGTGVAWVNRNEETGLITPPKDAAALAQAINHLLNDSALRARMGRAGRQRLEQEFTSALMVERVEQVYENALA